ncbi:ScbR family autoregulator-binding transcription factor [Microbacterium sp. NPDC077663]|uniref:ScbR family autoregulator-binding transcription factor n=1 Tax=Microbacterium sp. NPDC077663 TaxID=3364189 RepID=UPI0037C7ACC2
MTPRRSKPPQDRAVATRTAIIKGAAKAFAQHGYATATLAQIARETTVTNGAFYFHFPTREAVALAVIDNYQQIIEQLVGEATNANDHAMEVLFAVSASFAKRMRSDPIVQAGIVLTTERTGLPRAVNAPYKTWIESVELALRKASEEGDLRADLPIHDVAAHMVATFTGVQMVSAGLTNRRDLAARLRRSWAFLLPSITPADRLASLLSSLERSFPPPAGAASS